MKFLSDYHISHDSLISRDWATSHESEADKLREQTIALIKDNPQDNMLTKMQEIRKQYEKAQQQKKKEKQKSAKEEEFRSILLGI